MSINDLLGDCPQGGKHKPFAAGDANDGGPIHCFKCQALLRSRTGATTADPAAKQRAHGDTGGDGGVGR